ncbi:MAG: hypothetical protein ACREHD_20410 [Pirellulales bacterium]
MAKLQFDAERIAEFRDAREMPVYGIPQAAHYLQIPVATLRSWVLGRDYPTGRGKRRFKPVIALPDKKNPLLSFFNLAEAHVLSALRRDHSIRLQDIRSALNYIQNELGAAHPLLDYRFETDGIALFVTKLGKHGTAAHVGRALGKKDNNRQQDCDGGLDSKQRAESEVKSFATAEFRLPVHSPTLGLRCRSGNWHSVRWNKRVCDQSQ